MKKYLKENKWTITILIILSILDSLVISGVPLITESFIDYIPNLNATYIGIFSALFVEDVALILIFEYYVKLISAKLYRNYIFKIKE